MVKPKLSNLDETINLEVNNCDCNQGKEILEYTGEHCVPDIRDDKEKKKKNGNSPNPILLGHDLVRSPAPVLK